MPSPSCMRRFAAALIPCLLALPAFSQTLPRTEYANLISFVPLAVTAVTEPPTAVRGNMIRANDGKFVGLATEF